MSQHCLESSFHEIEYNGMTSFMEFMPSAVLLREGQWACPMTSLACDLHSACWLQAGLLEFVLPIAKALFRPLKQHIETKLGNIFN